MKRIWIILAATIFTAASAVASDKTDVMTAVNQFVDAFNKGDTKTAAAACTEEASIIDEFPPHEWHGAGACMTWMNDYAPTPRKMGSRMVWSNSPLPGILMSPQTTRM